MMISNFYRKLFVKKSKLKKFILDIQAASCLRFIVFLACFIIVIFQLREYWIRAKNPPVITHTKLTLNETVTYPALTICREPPYNKRFYKQFNFSGLHLGSYPITSYWNDFPYHIYNISEFWKVAVYDKRVITSYGLGDLLPVHIDLQSSVHFTTGLCHTIRPKKVATAVGKKPGYHILLTHDLYNYDPFRDKEAGWHIYVHETKEKYSENINIYSGRQARVFVPVGEKVEVSLEAYQFSSVQNCLNDPYYSTTECEERAWIFEDVSPRVNCSGPWLPSLAKPLCSDANEMIDLVKATLLMNETERCKRHCKTIQYKTSIVKRTPYPVLRKYTSGAWIYFASKAVINVEEKYSYDWNAFIADLGGSIGFLLGLSVFGIIGYLECVIHFALNLTKVERKDNSTKSVVFSDQSYSYPKNKATVVHISK